MGFVGFMFSIFCALGNTLPQWRYPFGSHTHQAQNSRMNTLTEYVSRARRGLTRLMTVVILGACGLSLLLAGIVATLLWLPWSLLRGKKPALFTLLQTFQRMSRQYPPGPTTGPGEVVDVQAHEVRQVLTRPGGADRA
jgi:hypothetical protein